MSGAHQMPRAWAKDDVRLLRYGKTKSIFKKGIPEVGDYKKCPRCGETKSITEFSKNRSRKDGLQAYCKPCMYSSDKESAHRHPEKRRDRSNRWKRRNPEKTQAAWSNWYKAHAEQQRNRRVQKYHEHPEESRARSARWRLEHPNQHRIAQTRWQREHPEAVAAGKQKRRARKVGNGGSFTAAEWKALKEYCGNRCLCCRRDDVKLEADHVLPLSLGGGSNISNIQPLCRSCNSKKHDKYVDYRHFNS